VDPACGWIEDTFCHGLVWDVRANRPFAAHRVLEGLLLAWALMAWCLQPGWWPTEPSWTRPLATLGSVLCFPSIVEDLISCNLLVYPALQSMDRLLTASASGNRNLATQRFYGSALLLIAGIGGLSNLLSTTLSKRGTFGLHGSIAASLGYLLATKPSQLLVRYWGLFHMTASDILLAVTAIGLVDALLGVRLPVMGRMGRRNVLSWMVGGVLGNLMGQYQVENYTQWWHPIRYY